MTQKQMASASIHDDEIDLFELAQNIWREKILVATTCGIITLLALIYALYTTPIYQVSSVLKPALIMDLDQLNSLDIYTLSPEEALSRVGASLESYAVRFEFFNQNQELFADLIDKNLTLKQNFEKINEKTIKLLKPDRKKNESFAEFVRLQFQYPKGIDGAAIVNGLVSHAIDVEHTLISADLKVIINNKLDAINRQLEVLRTGYFTEKNVTIASLKEQDKLKKLQLNDELVAIRQSLQTRRENRIAQLDEAMVITESLGIKKAITLSGLTDFAIQIAGGVNRTENNNQKLALYFLGTEALQAEKDTLLSRKDDDFTSGRIIEIQQELKLLEHNREIEVLNKRENEDLFLAELADKQKEITLLKSINVNMDYLKLVRIDQYAEHPTSAIKPKRKLIVAIGFVSGSMLGIFVALLRSIIRKRKEEAIQNA